MNRESIRWRRWTGIIAATMSALALGACDPCFGTTTCDTGPRLALMGQIVDAATGEGIDGVGITVTRESGVTLARETLATTTSNGGLWQVSADAMADGDVTVSIDVVPGAPLGAYRVEDLTFATVTRSGDARVIDRWVVAPYVPVVGEFFYRGTNDQRVEGATVTFRRTGGALLAGGTPSAPGEYSSTTDPAGRVRFLPYPIHTMELAPVTGDLTIAPPSPHPVTILRDVTFVPTYLYQQAPGIFRVEVASASSPLAATSTRIGSGDRDSPE